LVEVKILNGTLVESFLICKRQAWLMGHQIIPDQDHPYLEMGRLIDEESYIEEKKKISLENMVIDLIKMENKKILIGEIKKSSKIQDVAKLQLIFYLYTLKKYGIKLDGVLLFPKEKKKIYVELDEENEKRIINTIEEINRLINQPYPPKPEKIKYCNHCAYKEFCWA